MSNIPYIVPIDNNWNVPEEFKSLRKNKKVQNVIRGIQEFSQSILGASPSQEPYFDPFQVTHRWEVFQITKK